jgi:hypothetical protein
MVIDF